MSQIQVIQVDLILNPLASKVGSGQRLCTLDLRDFIIKLQIIQPLC